MKKVLALALLSLITTGVSAENKRDSLNKNKPVFTVVKENKITVLRIKVAAARVGITQH